jgi:hypothetical protein
METVARSKLRWLNRAGVMGDLEEYDRKLDSYQLLFNVRNFYKDLNFCLTSE